MAVHTCSYWFNYKTDRIQVAKTVLTEFVVVRDLYCEIDPTNPIFMDIHLKTLTHVYKFNPEVTRHNFCHYLLGRSWRPQTEFEVELKSLINLFVYNGLEGADKDSCCEDVKCFLAEINVVLVEAACLCEAVRKGHEINCPPSCELLTKICLLKAEHFLKKLLHDANDTSFSFIFKSYHIGELNDILNNLRRFSEDLPHEKMKYRKQRLALIEQVAEQVASLCQAFEAWKITEYMVKNSLLQLLLKIVISKAESFLMELLSKNNATFMDYGKDHIQLLIEQLNFFTLILTNQLIEGRKDGDMILAEIEAFARWVTCFSSSLGIKKKAIVSFSELLDKAKRTKAKLKEIGPQFPLSNFPKTYKVGFIDFLSRNLRELLEYDYELIAPVKHHIEEIQLHLKSLSAFFMRVSELYFDEHPQLNDLGDHIIDVAYKLEYVIHLIEVDAHWQNYFWFYYLLDELRLVDTQASRIRETISDAKVENATLVSCYMKSQDRRPAINEMVVNLSHEEEVIIDKLTRGSSQRSIVSIVGIPGIGKTTLARKMYNNQNIIYHFHCRAWCTVSQVYDKRELLLEILSDIHGLSDEIYQMSREDLESILHQCLLKNKYLIVMDDIWNVEAWNDFKNSFPDNVNGSRILITSRLRDVAIQIEPDSDPHFLRPFSDYESWKLLDEKIFHGEGCPKELLLVGKQIAQQCQGLPLSVVVIAGLLGRTEKRKEWWEKIAEILSFEMMADPEVQCMKILELSYRHLPGHLKACFLHLAVFVEDRDIPVSKLIGFWLAEGLIQRDHSNSLEDVAQDYLMDLINRSLVTISKRRSNGKVKACRLHDRLRDLCVSKAKEENFLQFVTRFDEPYASFPSSNYGFDLYFDHHLQPVIYEAYRLSILLNRNHFVESRPFGLGTRSLIFFASADSEPRCPYDISFICHNFKFLRVLDFECINMGISFPVEIGLLVGLRYLAVSGYVRSIPQSIANLRNLETFIIKGLRGKVVLPDTVWHMKKLRHLHVNNHAAFNLDDEVLGYFQLENLLSLSCLSLSCGENSEKIIKRFPNLCKLRCMFFESRDSSKNCNQLPRLDFLIYLESLTIFYYGKALNTSKFILPLNLKKLTLSNFRLPWNHISAIGRLPNLQVLKLVSGAFEGRIWDTREEGFRELVFLKLDTLNITQWNAGLDHLPKLQHLVIKNCKDLEKIPYDFVDITTLRTIEVLWCGESAKESAKEIGDATGKIKVLISS
ncbi:hypothetical protein ACH5RR_032647 [Cinchona calisaya]|uniref:Late blight resistance protein homolog R1A-3 n=1 Tax=Cinchona calisaya TaxID=153742 RepID=A0ABD2YMW0_9GENT